VDVIEDLRLVDGPVLWIAWSAGLAGMAYLLWQTLRRRGTARGTAPWLEGLLPVTCAVLLAAVLVAAAHWLLIYVYSVFPEELPADVLAWSVAAVAALLLWCARLWATWPRRTGSRTARSTAAATGALLGVLLLSAGQINAYFGLNNTVSDLTGTAVARIQPLEAGLQRVAGAPAGTALSQWHPPDGLPDGGELRRAAIPGTVSGFQSRDAYIYLPPAYLASPRPALPVLVLFAGQPGAPSDWLTGGGLRSRMDRFADAHHGVAPVVVVVDPNGTPAGNTLCMDSRIAQADTFLSRDVPAWIDATLDVDPDRAHWAAGGFSFGATCAVQMVTRHPDVYSSALAFASEKEPALAKERDKTVAASFGGDTEAFDRQTPLNLMKERNYRGHAIFFGAGVRDPEFTGYMDLLSGAARTAGFDVAALSIPNAGHSWDTASRGLTAGLDFLAPRWGIQP
jgi:S-formylglutathione hydrolase FrmB